MLVASILPYSRGNFIVSSVDSTLSRKILAMKIATIHYTSSKLGSWLNQIDEDDQNFSNSKRLSLRTASSK